MIQKVDTGFGFCMWKANVVHWLVQEREGQISVSNLKSVDITHFYLISF